MSTPDFQTLPREQLRESPTNPRKHFSPARLAELAESIKASGIKQPLVVRPIPRPLKGKVVYEIVIGARRYRAAGTAGLAEIPCLIEAMTDEQMVDVQLLEMSHGDDVHPHDEGRAFKRLAELHGWTAAQIAERVGRPRGHVSQRLALTNLCAEPEAAFLEEKILVGHANMLARLPPVQQLEVWEQHFHGKRWDGGKEIREFDAPAVAELADLLERSVYMSLATVPWDLADAELVPAAGACTVCPKRTGANLDLFDSGSVDHCLDRECYAAKMTARLVQIDTGTKGLLHVATIYAGGHKDKLHPKLRKGLIESHNYYAIDGKPCASAKPALVVYGPKIGEVIQVCVDPACLVHHPVSGKASRSGSTSSGAAQKKVAAQEMERAVQVEARRRAWKLLLKENRLKLDKDRKLVLLKELVHRCDNPELLAEQMGPLPASKKLPEEAIRDAAKAMPEPALNRLLICISYDAALDRWISPETEVSFKKLLKDVGIKYDTLERSAALDLKAAADQPAKKAKGKKR